MSSKSQIPTLLQLDNPNSRPESSDRFTTRPAANSRLPTTLPGLNYQGDTTAERAAAALSDDDILQVRYLIRMPESDAAMHSRSQPDEYGEIVSHGPMEMGVWQTVIDTRVPNEDHLRASEESTTKSENAHVNDDWKS